MGRLPSSARATLRWPLLYRRCRSLRRKRGWTPLGDVQLEGRTPRLTVSHRPVTKGGTTPNLKSSAAPAWRAFADRTVAELGLTAGEDRRPSVGREQPVEEQRQLFAGARNTASARTCLWPRVPTNQALQPPPQAVRRVLARPVQAEMSSSTELRPAPSQPEGGGGVGTVLPCDHGSMKRG